MVTSSNTTIAAEAPTIDDHTTKESLLGTERRGRPSNVSWGAVIAGVVTFLAVTVLLSLVTAGIGLGGSGIGAGIWSIIALALALAAGGFVAGALAVRAGVIHGFLTWATSLVVALALTVALGASVLGAVGGVVGNLTSAAAQVASGTDVEQVAGDAADGVSQEDLDNAQDQVDQTLDDAQQVAEDAAQTAQAGAWFGFVGLLVGALIASAGGAFGVRSVVKRASGRNVAVVTPTR